MADQLARFKGRNTSRDFLTSAPDSHGGEFVIYVKSGDRIEFEYIIRRRPSDDQQRLLQRIATHCNFNLVDQKVFAPHSTHNPDDIIRLFGEFESSVLEAIQLGGRPDAT